MKAAARRYDSKIDLSDKNTSHTQQILLTGRNKKVLEVGPATGYMTEVLSRRGCRVTGIEMDADAAESARRHCERMIVADVEQLDFKETFGDTRFDVILFGDVLEHLVDPEAVLVRVRPLLAPNGYIVASIPNMAHASMRIMLLDGRFGYTDKGLRDRTHLRFFTRAGIEDLFRAAGFRISVWRRTSTAGVEDPFGEGLSHRQSDVPSHLLDALQNDADASTYQFVIRAFPAKNAPRSLAYLAHRSARSLNGSVLKTLRDWQDSNQAAISAKDARLAQVDTVLAQKDGHIANIETALHQANVQAAAAQHQLNLITGSAGYRLLELVRRPIRWLAPQGSRRHLGVKAAARALSILMSEGPVTLVRRALPVWRWLPRLRRGFVVQQGATLDDEYQLWLKAHELTPARTRSIRRAAASLAYRPLVSIVMPVYNPDPAWLRDAIESVRAQLYDNWELCIADDGSRRAGVRELLERYQRDEPRARVDYLSKNAGIAAASNAALALATGEFVGLLDHDDKLKPDALFEVAKLLNDRRDLDYVYSDEDKLETDGRLVEPFFKPDWSPDLLMSVNYVTHFSVFRKEIIDKVDGFRAGFDGSQDYDLVLRVAEVTDRIAHIAKPLYTWRKIPGSAASSVEAKSYAFRAGKKALKDALSRRGTGGEVLDGLVKGRYRVRYEITGNPKVAIIIPTRDRLDMLRRCVDSIRQKSSYENYEIIVVDNDSQEEETLEYLSSFGGRVIKYPHEFSFAKIVNLGAQEADCDALLFLNNDTEIITPEWIEAMLEHGQRPEVAAVGARLLYPDGRVQHEGVIMGLGGGSAGNVDHGGYFALGETPHNRTAVTAACMLTRPSVFRELGGFDERLRVAFNDVDFCLRAREKGYFIVYTPYATLYHYESATRGKLHPQEDERFFRDRWGDPGEYRDPYYNPNLDLEQPFRLRV